MSKNTIFIAMIVMLLAAAGSLPLLANRWQAEENDRQVEIAIPGEWAMQKGELSLSRLQELKESGATTVMLEVVLPKLDSGASSIELVSADFKSNAATLSERHGWEVMAYISAERFPVQEEQINKLFKELAAAGIKRVQFAGMEVPGYAGDLRPLASSLTENNIHTVLVKSQRGALELSRLSDYQSIRSLFFDSQRLQSMPVGEAVDAFQLGIRERGIRLVTFMPQRGTDAKEDEQAAAGRMKYENHAQAIIEKLREQLKDEYGWGGARPIADQYSEPGKLWRTFPVAGIGALFLLLAGTIREALTPRIRTALTLLIAAGTAVIWAGWMAAPSGWSGRIESVIALWGAIAAPSAAVLWLSRWYKRSGLSGQELESAAELEDAAKNHAEGGRTAAEGKRAKAGMGGTLLRAAAGYAAAVLIASAGIIYVSALLSGISYLAYIDMFRGVKLLYVGPIALIALGLLLQSGAFKSWRERNASNSGAGSALTAAAPAGGSASVGAPEVSADSSASAGSADVRRRGHAQSGTRAARNNSGSRTRKRLLLAAALLAGGAVMAYLLARTGNSDMVLPYEGELRRLLSDLFGVRPRTKEWLIGYPLLMLAACMLARRRNSGVWLLPIGAIGLCSMVNTFTHLHSPLSISLTRSWTGVLLGGAIGIAVYIAVSLRTVRDRGQDATMEGK